MQILLAAGGIIILVAIFVSLGTMLLVVGLAILAPIFLFAFLAETRHWLRRQYWRLFPSRRDAHFRRVHAKLRRR
jgi:predicted PurR-regulated permease PerM